MPSIEEIILMRADGTFYCEVCTDGGYPWLYIDSTRSHLCAHCATDLYNRCIYGDNETSYTLCSADVYYEGPTVYCAECNGTIESAYGDPDECEEE